MIFLSVASSVGKFPDGELRSESRLVLAETCFQVEPLAAVFVIPAQAGI